MQTPQTTKGPSEPESPNNVCPNCEQWQNWTSKGYYDCFHDCAERGFADKRPTPAHERPSASQNRAAEVAESVLKAALREEMYGKPTPEAIAADKAAQAHYRATHAAAMPEEAPQAQHSPLPWHRATDNEGSAFAIIAHNGNRIGTLNQTNRETNANAKLIVRSVNNAEKLAEALRDLREVCERIGAPAITQGGLCEEEDWATGMRKSDVALAAWEGVKQ